ncbi:cadmium-translocating P-type ATPase [Eubacteriales bacterium OttesenSCG-928-A19]|nr:cadmium-translocating P-type ATPase [Eubacteriales bacterium OttesenSCG-928-A19]
MNKKLVRIIIAAVIFVVGLLVKTNIVWLSPAIFIAAYIVVGAEVVIKAFKNILQGQVFQESFLMTVATVGALIIGEYPEAIAVMLFYQVGEYFQSYAVAKSRKSIANLMDIRPDYANVKRGDELVEVDPDEVAIGDVIVVRAGEKIPLDGKVLDGNSMIDTSALTGESVPREATIGSDVLSGCINVNGVLMIEVTKEFGESTVSKILDLVENASSKKANTENFITKFARVYTPIVLGAALLIAIIPPLVFGGAWGDWIYRALTFLVVSCPCALVVSIPLSFFGGIGGASRSGVLVKGSNYLEALAKTEIVVFDKTGTLTKGVFNVQEVNAVGISKDNLLEITAYVEGYSNHPISLSLKAAYGKAIDNERIANVEEIPGHGVSAIVDGRKVYAGNVKLMRKIGVMYSQDEIVGTAVHVAIDGQYAGYIVIADEVKEDAAEAIRLLKRTNIRQTVMLTGDARNVGEKVAKELGLDKVCTELLPGDKVEKVEELLVQKSAKGKLAFVGDGINDAPVLVRADIGIAMGGLGSDAAIEAADVVIMTDEPSKLATAMKISQKTLRIAQQNIWLALSIKAIVLALSAFGIATMWEAVFADVGVTVIAVLNSFRTLNTKNL